MSAALPPVLTWLMMPSARAYVSASTASNSPTFTSDGERRRKLKGSMVINGDATAAVEAEGAEVMTGNRRGRER